MTSRSARSCLGGGGLLFLVALAGCPSDDAGNAPVLYLAPDGSEIKVHLIESEPRPF